MISSAECSTWLAVFLTVTVAVVAVNLLSIILFVNNSNLRTRAMYLVINLTVADMFVGEIFTVVIVLLFLFFGCEGGNPYFVFICWAGRATYFFVLNMTGIFLPLTSVAGIAVISLERIHATFRPFRHRNIKKWTYGVTIAGVWILTTMMLIPFSLIRLYGNLHQQWQLVFPFYLWRSYCCLCLIVICVSYTSIALKFWCGTCPPWHGAANRLKKKLTVTLFIMTIVSLLLWLPYVVYILLILFMLKIGFFSGYIYAWNYLFLFYTTQTRLLIPLFTQSECQSS